MKFWGKADEPFKAAYYSGQEKEKILTEFKSQVSSRLNKPEKDLKILDLDKLAKLNHWQYNQENYSSWHPLAYHMLDVAAVADVWLENDEELYNLFQRLSGFHENSMNRIFTLARIQPVRLE